MSLPTHSEINNDEHKDSFLFQLIRMRKAIVRRCSHLIAEAGISLKLDQFPFLMILQKHPGFSQRELSDITLRDKSSVLRSINALEKKKLLVIEQDMADKRRNNITLTPAGDKLATTIRGIMKAAEDEVLSVLSAEERKQALNTLKHYADRLENL